MTLIGMESLVREIEAEFRHVSATVVFQAVDANGDHVTVNGESIVFSPRVSIVLRDGVPDTVPDLEPTDGSFGWSVKVSILSGRYSREWLKGVPTSTGVVAFGDLPNLDRATLQPTEDVVAAWDTVRAETFQARDDTQGLRDETQTLRDEAGASAGAAGLSAGAASTSATTASTAATTATTAAGTAGSAATAAGTARDGAVAAKTAAETARDQAQAVAASKGQPNGIGSLDASGKQPESQVPDRLTSTALAAAFVSLKAAAKNPDLLVVGNITRDANQAVTSADVVWPDGTPGTFTAETLSSAFPGAVDGYRITYGSPVTKTFTQPAITRNSAGAATTVPQIVMS